MSPARETPTPSDGAWVESHPTHTRGPDPRGEHVHALGGSYGRSGGGPS